MEIVINCDKVTHYYGERLIYKDLSFSVEKGRILGLLGKNGTGKTTIINILNGYLKPRSGVCSIFGENMSSIRPETKARIGLLLEGHIQHNYMNVLQIEKYYSMFFKKWNKDFYYELIKKLQISEKQKINTMSCGQRSQVALGLLFAQDPDLLILDDFSMGLDPGYRRLFVEYLKNYINEGNKTVFVTSHIIQDMEMLIDDCMILDYGKILTHRPTKEIMDNFQKFTFKTTAEINLMDDRIWNPERVGDTYEFYSFCKNEEIAHILEIDSADKSILRSDLLSLEDAFIGLTGKY